MPSKLYVYLKGGGYAHVTDAWNGSAPSDEGTFDNSTGALSTYGREVGEPYRDIHRYSLPIQVKNGSDNGGTLTLPGTAVVPASITPASFSGGTTGVASATIGALSVKTSDDVANAKPRLFTKVCTWLVFTADDGIFKFRKAHVIGWGANPLTE